MVDSGLIVKLKAAREAAHDAPLARIYEENIGGRPTGVKHISDHTSGWADRSREFVALWQEAKKRRLI